MAPNLSKLVTRKRLVCAASVSVVLWLISRKKKKNVRLRSTTIFKCWLLNGGTASLKLVVLPKNNNLQCKHPVVHDIQYTIGEKSPAKTKAQVDAVFFAQLKKILSICVKGIFTPESGFLILVASSLVARSLCDIWMIQNHTATENAIVTMDKMLFRKHLVEFFIAMPLISLVNNILKWSIGELKLRLRTQLTHYLYDEYLRGFTYYKMANLDTRIANADQLLTTDVDKFCDVFADLYSNVCKPVLDIFIYVYQLTTNLGGTTPGIMMIYLAIAGVFLTWLRRPAGRMTVWEQKLEGEFRYINSRLITNSEEIAFYSGSNREKLTVLTAFKKLTDHMRKFLEFRVLMGTVDNIIAKYFATVVGFFAVSLPFMSVGNQLAFTDKDERFKQYYSSGRMLVKLAEAIGRLVLAGREMTHLAGFTARVTEIMDVLKDINQGHYERTMIDDKRKEQNEIVALTEQNSHIKKPLIPGAGRIIYQDNVIRFDRVPLVTPNGDVLIEELTFEVKSGMNVLVCGPNGCGKSSLFRILGELWPLFGGCLTKPPRGKLFYIPQRPYMTLGTLRDQVIYPHTKEEMIRRGKTDASINEHLSRVQLSYLLQRENGWDTIADWIDVLSGGEKQRIAMARLFYHQPQFAILDECTSAVSVDVEGSMYQYCKETDITLFTVSHRRSLWKHHEYYLQMNGRGGFDFKPIDADTKEFGS